MAIIRWQPIVLVVFLAAQIVPSARALDEIRVQLKWYHQFQFAGYYAAIEKGFYREAGLDVTLIEGRPTLDPALVVLAGEAEFGVGTPEILLLRAADAPLVVLGVIFQHSPYVFLSLASSGIDNVTELSGQRVMIEPQAAELSAYLKREHVDLSSLKFVPHTFSAASLLDGSVESMSAYVTDEPFELHTRKVPHSILSPRSGGIDFYGDCFFTTETQINDHPERVRAFYDATIRGWKYAFEHRDEIIDLILADYPTRKSRAALEFEYQKMRDLIHPEIIPVGYMYPGRWQHIAETYAELGMLDPDISLDGFLYQRNPAIDYTSLYWVTGIAAAVAFAALAWLVPLVSLNRRLQREIVDRRVAERAIRVVNEAQSRYIAVMGHEVRTPLSGIKSSIALLKETDDAIERTELVDILDTSADALLLMVDEILDHAKLEAGEMRVEMAPLPVADLLSGVQQLFLASADIKDLRIEVAIDPSAPKVIVTDQIRLRQILSNLVGNAVKFTNEGSVTLSCSPAASPDRLRFTVTDTGPGIQTDQIDTIFEPYHQSRSGSRVGTGLGLTICRQLARLLGGEITVVSPPGLGATFTVELPVELISTNR